MTGLTPGQILGDNKTNGLDWGELMQYRTAGLMALGVEMRRSNDKKAPSIELESILGAGIA